VVWEPLRPHAVKLNAGEDNSSTCLKTALKLASDCCDVLRTSGGDSHADGRDSNGVFMTATETRASRVRWTKFTNGSGQSSGKFEKGGDSP